MDNKISREEATLSAFENYDASAVAVLLGYHVWHSLYRSDEQRGKMQELLTIPQQEVLSRFCSYTNYKELVTTHFFDLSNSCLSLMNMLNDIDERGDHEVLENLNGEYFDLMTAISSIMVACNGRLNYAVAEEYVRKTEDGKIDMVGLDPVNVSPSMYFRMSLEVLSELESISGATPIVPNEFKDLTIIDVDAWSDDELMSNFHFLRERALNLRTGITIQKNEIAANGNTPNIADIKYSFCSAGGARITDNAISAICKTCDMFYGPNPEKIQPLSPVPLKDNRRLEKAGGSGAEIINLSDWRLT